MSEQARSDMGQCAEISIITARAAYSPWRITKAVRTSMVALAMVHALSTPTAARSATLVDGRTYANLLVAHASMLAVTSAITSVFFPEVSGRNPLFISGFVSPTSYYLQHSGSFPGSNYGLKISGTTSGDVGTNLVQSMNIVGYGDGVSIAGTINEVGVWSEIQNGWVFDSSADALFSVTPTNEPQSTINKNVTPYFWPLIVAIFIQLAINYVRRNPIKVITAVLKVVSDVVDVVEKIIEVYDNLGNPIDEPPPTPPGNIVDELIEAIEPNPALLKSTGELGRNIVTTSQIYTNFQTGAVTSVPEPSTWLLQIVGFGFIGAIMRRRQRMCFSN